MCNQLLMSFKLLYLLIFILYQENGSKFVRPVYAGNAIATVSSKDSVKLITIRSTNFEKIAQGAANQYPVEEVKASVDKVQG